MSQHLRSRNFSNEQWEGTEGLCGMKQSWICNKTSEGSYWKQLLSLTELISHWICSEGALLV